MTSTCVLANDVDVPLSARRSRTRQRILAAALLVFAERGVRGAKVEKICQQAGLTRGAFYSNFTDLDDLVVALLHQHPAQPDQPTRSAGGEPSADGSRGGGHGTPDLAEALLEIVDQEVYGGTPDRTLVLVERELALHVARVPELRTLYAQLCAIRSRRLSRQVAEKVHAAQRELTLPLDTTLELLMATHRHYRGQVLQRSAANPAPWSALINTITRNARAEEARHHP